VHLCQWEVQAAWEVGHFNNLALTKDALLLMGARETICQQLKKNHNNNRNNSNRK